MATGIPMDDWKRIPWKKVHRNVFRLQKRIYRASSRDEYRTVRKLQRLLLRSTSAKWLAVRQVAQDNQGKRTAGIDGIKLLTPQQRLALTKHLVVDQKASPVRRLWIPKPGTEEKRQLGIPTMHDRALQTLVKAALEPEWEARFEPNSYGFRPGRSGHDAIEALFVSINGKPKWALDADITKCFDRIEPQALLRKFNTSPLIRGQLKAWLQAGMLDGEKLFPTTRGTPQGSPLSPLLMNIALHGLETKLVNTFPHNGRRNFNPPTVVRYADDLVVLHSDLSVVRQCHEILSDWLKEMGLELKASKTRIVHTLETTEEGVGFNFLGFTIRQYRVGKTKSGKNKQGQPLGFKTIIRPSKEAVGRHIHKLRGILRSHRAVEQEKLIHTLNPKIVGWANYYSTVVSKETFGKLGVVLFHMLFAWATSRHPDKGKKWIFHKYWRHDGQRWRFQPERGDLRLLQHSETPIRRHVKVKGHRSPFEGEWVYWSTRLGRHPEVSPRVAKLLKKQQGKCGECGWFFKDGDAMEVDHLIPTEYGGKDAYYNLQLLHHHCHETKTARDSDWKRCA
jgi:RNA-directed DNA polymerase